MIEVTIRKYGFRLRQIWFAEEPYDSEKCDIVMFYYARKPPVEAMHGKFIAEASNCQCVDTTKSLEEIQKGFNYNTRSEIRNAEKEKLEVRLNSGYEEFVELFAKQADYKRLKLKRLPAESLRLQEHLLVSVWGENKQHPLACDYAGVQDKGLYIIFICNARCMGEDQRLVSRASRLAHWEALKWAREHGCREVSVGALGDDPSDKGNVEFKKGFGGYEKKLTAYTRIYNPALRVLWRFRKGNGVIETK
jgi:hypothetical protein